MRKNVHGDSRKTSAAVQFRWVVLLVVATGAAAADAQIYVSAEPIPDADVVGVTALARIESLDYSVRARWSERLFNDCRIVRNVIDTLTENHAVGSLNSGNAGSYVAPGGFQGVTDPSYVVAMPDSGPRAVKESDAFVLANALGYALNQSGTAQIRLHFEAGQPHESSNAYATVTFAEGLTGEQARAFFDYLGTVDPELRNGPNAGFTSVNFNLSGQYDSMLFLEGNVGTPEFVAGLFQAATTTNGATYSPIGEDGTPTVATAGVAFPGNDWKRYPNGDKYLEKLANPSSRLLSELAALRKRHLLAVGDLLSALGDGDVDQYLNGRFRCPD